MATNTLFLLAQFSGSKDGTMTGATTIKSAWIIMPPNCKDFSFEALWTGNATGTISFDERIGVFPIALNLTALDQPDGTVYAGDLDASTTDLEAEDLGSSGDNVTGVNGNAIRVQYVNSAGSGTINVRITFKVMSKV